MLASFERLLPVLLYLLTIAPIVWLAEACGS
jgi:hypothetical protein